MHVPGPGLGEYAGHFTDLVRMNLAAVLKVKERQWLLPASCQQRIRYCQQAVTCDFAADSQYNLWMILGFYNLHVQHLYITFVASIYVFMCPFKLLNIQFLKKDLLKLGF